MILSNVTLFTGIENDTILNPTQNLFLTEVYKSPPINQDEFI